jgi:hypothetical protein
METAATASTLSSDIETSAMRMVSSALPKVFGALPWEAMLSAMCSPLTGSSTMIGWCAFKSAHMRQATQNSSMPPTNKGPGMLSSAAVAPAKMMRKTSASATPQKMALRCRSGANAAAARPTATALSPASARSMRMT